MENQQNHDIDSGAEDNAKPNRELIFPTLNCRSQNLTKIQGGCVSSPGGCVCSLDNEEFVVKIFGGIIEKWCWRSPTKFCHLGIHISIIQ